MFGLAHQCSMPTAADARSPKLVHCIPPLSRFARRAGFVALRQTFVHFCHRAWTDISKSRQLARSSSAGDASPLISRFGPCAGSAGLRQTFAQKRQTFALARQSHRPSGRGLRGSSSEGWGTHLGNGGRVWSRRRPVRFRSNPWAFGIFGLRYFWHT
jgi:hypothetical protein